jgi:replicative DNA helicase
MQINGEDAKAAEMSVLAAALLEPWAVGELLGHLTRRDFILPENQAVYEAIKGLEAAGKPVDAMMLADALRDDRATLAAGGMDYLIALASFLPSAVNLQHYMAIVAANSRERRIADSLRRITLSHDEALPQLKALVEEEQAALKPVGAGVGLGEQIEALIGRLADPAPGQRIHSGIPKLDSITGGLPKKCISVVGARPGVGKTCLMLNWSMRAITDRHRATVFSLEMPAEHLLERFASFMAKVSYSDINQNKAERADILRIGERLVDLMSGDRLTLIDDVSSVEGIVSEIARTSPDIVFIDYMQIVEPERRYRDSRTREIAETARTLKKAAKKFDCHICVLSQLNRDASEREPTKTDFAESDSQAQQFDYCMLLHRPPFYIPNRDVGGNRATLILDKNKYGAPTRLKLDFDGAHQRFVEGG